MQRNAKIAAAQLVRRLFLAAALLAAGSDAKVGALFAQAELARNFCGQRSTLLAPTPKHRALWTAMEQKLRGRLGQ